MRLLLERAPRGGRGDDGELAPATLRLGPDARAVFEDWERECVARARELHAGEASATLVSWTSKLAGQTARLAALLFVLDHWTRDEPEPRLGTLIDADAMSAAVRLARDYFAPHAAAVFGAAAESSASRADVDVARRILGAIERRLESGDLSAGGELTTRDVHRWIGRGGERSFVYERGLTVLAELGWIELLEAGRPGRGTTSSRWRIHPSIGRK
jgi:hypothetical protein